MIRIRRRPGRSSNNGLTPATPLDSIQAALNLSITPGTVILVDSGVQDGFEATSADNGVIIMGTPGAATVISSDATLTNASNITIDGLQVDGAINVNGGSNIELVNNTGGSMADVLSGAGGTITLQLNHRCAGRAQQHGRTDAQRHDQRHHHPQQPDYRRRHLDLRRHDRPARHRKHASIGYVERRLAGDDHQQQHRRRRNASSPRRLLARSTTTSSRAPGTAWRCSLRRL